MTKVTLQDIKNAKETIKDIVKQTDILESAKLSAMTGANVFYLDCHTLTSASFGVIQSDIYKHEHSNFKFTHFCLLAFTVTEYGQW